MPVYEYTVLDSKGKKRSGIIDAESPYAARQRLRDKGQFPTDVREAPEGAAGKTGSGVSMNFDLGSLMGRVRPKQVSVMTRQLSTLLGAGLPLVTALETLIPQTPHPKLKRVMAHVKDAIVEGNSLGAALAQYPRVFSSLYINMVRAGEASGALELVLARLADLSERQEDTKRKVQGALIYPIIMILVGFSAVAFLMVKVVPTISSMFSDVDKALPMPTRVLIAASDFLSTWWWAVILAVVAGIFVFGRLRATKKGRWVTDQFILRLPLVGGLTVRLAAARFTGTLGSLLQNGVPMLNALEIVSALVQNVVISAEIQQAAEDVGEGKGLAESLRGKKEFPALAVQMMEVGEQSGELEAMLEKVAHMYQSEAEYAIDGMTTLLEPAMILFMAGAVGFIVVSILMPIIEMSQLVK